MQGEMARKETPQIKETRNQIIKLCYWEEVEAIFTEFGRLVLS